MRATSAHDADARSLRRESAAASFLPAIETSSPVPAVRQLYLQLRNGIVAGRLQPGHRLPSTRTAAREWSLSRGLIAESYDMLIAEGYAVGRHGSGTYVASGLPPIPTGVSDGHKAVPGNDTRALSAAARLAMRIGTPLPLQAPFATGRVIHDARTASLLKRLTLRHLDYTHDGYRDAQGEETLRQAIAAHLIASRGVRCEPGQIFVTSGTQQALDLVSRLLVSPGETVLVEDPCYPPARQAFVFNGALLSGIPVDRDGLITQALEAYDGPAPAAVYVTPSHQYPSGSALPLARRLQLLAFAQERGCWIIEDDYDSEFRYDGRPITSLQGLDATDRVIYLGTFSKALLPGIRVGYVIVPDDLVAAFRAARPIIDRFPAPLHQRVVADFLNEGYFPAHLRRLRERYRASRDFLARLLRERLAEHLIALPPEQGIHFTVSSTGSWADDRAVAKAALEEGVVVLPVSPMSLSAVAEPRLLLGFSGLTDEEADIGTRRLTRVFARLAS
ncbi:MocR-like pyridoxine biosynthesis transcription factor PdxR [Labrys neptuniae]